ncbi:nuclear transport factor 2 family protein [Polaromonas sp. P1-6]|nr:nuclear transport factor 2 family protein [Polaromonas sp. P1-6]
MGSTAAGKVGTFKGHDEIVGLLGGDLNVDFMKRGGAHVLSFPYVVIEGDAATATNHATVYIRSDDAHKAFRVVASRWELVRTPAGWRVKRRLNEVFDGSMAPRYLIGTRNKAEIGPYEVQK